MASRGQSVVLLFLAIACALLTATDAGIIKDLFKKVTNSGGDENRPEGGDKNSALICGGGLFKSPDEKSLSPEIIFITNRPSRTSSSNSNPNGFHGGRNNQREGRDGGVTEVAREFSFHEENVTLAELERYGFNRDAPTSFLMHGFTSGYPLQAWMSAIVEAYTIDRESSHGQSGTGHLGSTGGNFGGSSSSSTSSGHHNGGFGGFNNNDYGNNNNHDGYGIHQQGNSNHEYDSHHQTGNYNNQYGNDGHSYGGQSGGHHSGGNNYHSSGNSNHHGSGSSYNGNHDNYGQNSRWRNSSSPSGSHSFHRRDTSSNYGRDHRGQQHGSQGKKVNHNLFIVNWNYAARGILYPRAVANIPLVASYVARFINEKLLEEARVDPTHIQLIGHSLGAHLAGFTGKNTRERLGRIYGLDPAGPCFGAVAGFLFPASKRLDPSDAEEVITIHTNYALLGIEKPIGRYSVYVEGGKNQPGCKAGGVFKTVTTLTVDQASSDAIACSHSRAPNLLTYRHDQSDRDDDCQLIGYECKDWESYKKGHCGVCDASILGSDNDYSRSKGRNDRREGPLRSVECLRIGLDWQYPKKNGAASGRPVGSSNEFQRPTSSFGNSQRPNNFGNSGYGSDEEYENSRYNRTTRRPNGGFQSSGTSNNYGREPERDDYDRRTSTRRPHTSSSFSSHNNDHNQSGSNGYSSYEGGNYEQSSYNGRSTRRPYSSSQYNNGQSDYNGGYSPQEGGSYEHSGYNDRGTRRPGYSTGGFSRNKRADSHSNETVDLSTERRGNDKSPKPVIMFLKTGDTQPFCTFQYQVVLELNEPFKKSQPPMSLVLQDSDSDREHHDGHHGSHQQSSSSSSGGKKEQNSIIDDEFGKKYDDRTYTQLVTSNQKLKRIGHATLLFRSGLPDGHRILKTLHVNYMSHIDPNVRRKLSATLCPVRSDQDRGREREKENADTRFYFKPC